MAIQGPLSSSCIEYLRYKDSIYLRQHSASAVIASEAGPNKPAAFNKKMVTSFGNLKVVVRSWEYTGVRTGVTDAVAIFSSILE
jgi:hypothetical protein